MATTTQPAPISTEWGCAAPPGGQTAPRHAVTVHTPKWQGILDFIDMKPDFFKNIKSMYPRFMPHKDVAQLIRTILTHAKLPGKACLPYPSKEAAVDCQTFITAPPKATDKKPIPTDDVQIRTFDIGARIYVVFFPAEHMKSVMSFWTNAGVGMSSRFAEECLKHADSLREVTQDDESKATEEEAPIQKALCDRIATLVDRAPVGPARSTKTDDVFLYQTGMAAIYYVHQYLLKWRGTKTVMFGYPFHSTVHIFDYWGPGMKWLLGGTEFDELESYLESQIKEGIPVQAVWTEFPSNPLLVSSDLHRLRELADKYDFILIVDETIGGFSNIDVTPVADITITSLTKAFSGYADVMGGSAVLSPISNRYNELKSLFESHYHNDLCHLDAEALLHNNEDYLPRCQRLNDNANALINYLKPLISDPSSSVSALYYPSISPTVSNYNAFLRPTTPDFTPGYGCLFTIDFASPAATIAFYDNLHVHQGPHLGAHVTLAMPYAKLLISQIPDEERRTGLKETMIRISVGFQDKGGDLVERFKWAMGKADEALREEGRLEREGRVPLNVT